MYARGGVVIILPSWCIESLTTSYCPKLFVSLQHSAVQAKAECGGTSSGKSGILIVNFRNLRTL